MAKRLLDGYKIGGDIIDRLSSSYPAPRADAVMVWGEGKEAQALQANSVGQSPAESPPAGAEPPPVAEPLSPNKEPVPAAADTAQSAAAGEHTESTKKSSEPAPGRPSAAAIVEAPTSPAPAPEPGAEGGSEPSTQLIAGPKGAFQLFTIGANSYRIGGIKPLFVTSLRVNVRATNAELTYYDTLDLYSAKARSNFATALSRTWGVDPGRIEKDLVHILEYLERERDQQLSAQSGQREITISEEDRQAGLALLRDPQLFERIVADLSALGYVGEDLNKQLLYLCASSRKLDDPISVLILSQSASGKSFLVDSVKKLMPSEDVVAVTSLSDQALNYIEDLMHKFLVLGEAVHGDVVEHQIREMLSGKELSRMVTLKDPETGKMQSRIVRTPVVVASVMSGTNHAVNPENASRCFVVNTDESKEQTSRIHEHQRTKYSLDRIRGGEASSAQIIRTHQAAQRLLEKRAVVNSFAPLLDFPVSLMRLRRDHDRFLDLIACVCFLRQYQKPLRQDGAFSYIECDLADYEIAYRLMVEGVMSATVRELPKGAVVVYEEIRAWVKEEGKRLGLALAEVSFTQRQIREATGLGHTWVKNNLRQLVDYEYITIAKGGNERSKAFYRLRSDEDIARADLSMIPTPAVMRTLIEGKSQ